MALFHFLHLQLVLIIRILFILIVIFPSLLDLVEISNLLLLLFSMNLVEHKVTPSSNLFKHVCRDLIIPHFFPVYYDLFHSSQLSYDFLALPLTEPSPTRFHSFVKDTGLAVFIRTRKEREPHCSLLVKFTLTHFNNYIIIG